MSTAYAAATVVPAIPPRPPQVSLLGSAILPDDTADPTSSAPTSEQLAALPSDLRAELAAREGEMWVRGFTYAPENHGAATIRDRCDYSTPNLAELPTPTGLALAHVAGGTVPNETVSYQVTALNANGETTPCTVVTLATGAIGSVVLTWNKVEDYVETSYTPQYNVYGRVGGSIGLLATVGPFDDFEVATWTDTGAATPGAAPPGSNTTGGPGPYSNPAINLLVPFLIEVADSCSTFGWSERDFKGRALRWLDNATPEAIEREFWGGALAQAKSYPNNYLTNPDSVINLTPVSTPSVNRGLQILQDALQQTGFGGQGMIHVQAQTAPNLLGARRVGKLLLDIFDNIVVPGVGYDGSAPGGAQPSAGTAWMYATDLVMVRSQNEGTVFPDTMSEATTHGQGGDYNTVTFRAERFASAFWDNQAHYGCLVTLET